MRTHTSLGEAMLVVIAASGMIVWLAGGFLAVAAFVAAVMRPRPERGPRRRIFPPVRKPPDTQPMPSAASVISDEHAELDDERRSALRRRTALGRNLSAFRRRRHQKGRTRSRICWP